MTAKGGGIGKAVVEKVREALGEQAEIIALGTNAMATAAMLKAGANEGASGENAIAVNVRSADVITGSVAILNANAMLRGDIPGHRMRNRGEQSVKGTHSAQ